ncbi:MAG: hypothetical protein HQL50_07640 [Magnetococcales bacterium]|nr:hypothetical protein [Magnetococcales bacterium]
MIRKRRDPELGQALDVLEAGPYSPGYNEAWGRVAQSKDPIIQSALRETLEETYGPLPAPTGYSDDGEPYWDTDIMARYLRIDESYVEELAEETLDRWGDDAGVKHVSSLHKIQ